MMPYQVIRIHVPKPVKFNVIKISCKFPLFNLQLKKKCIYNNNNNIPYMSYDDPMHSQK